MIKIKFESKINNQSSLEREIVRCMDNDCPVEIGGAKFLVLDIRYSVVDGKTVFCAMLSEV